MKKDLQKNKILLAFLSSLSLAISSCGQTKEEAIKDPQEILLEKEIDLDIISNNNIFENKEIQEKQMEQQKEIKEPIKKEITISAVGDCTLGRDDKYKYENKISKKSHCYICYVL